jgi:RNA 2',3'-cyclic 3'-phosphodiesterase
VRLFVAVTPSPPVIETVAAIDRPAFADVRWTTEAQWHVTLRFLGEVDDPAGVAFSLDEVPVLVAGDRPVVAVLGPASAWFPGRRVLQVPVDGLDQLAGAVRQVTAPWGDPAPEHYRGHLTLARTRGRREGPPALAGAALSGSWTVSELALFSSVGGPGGHRYEVVHQVSVA